MKPEDLKVGDLVDYHPIIGQPATKFGMVVRHGPNEMHPGLWVVWLEGKAGCVAIEAVSRHEKEEK